MRTRHFRVPYKNLLGTRRNDTYYIMQNIMLCLHTPVNKSQHLMRSVAGDLTIFFEKTITLNQIL